MISNKYSMYFIKNTNIPLSCIQTYTDFTEDIIKEPVIYNLFVDITSNKCIEYAFAHSNKLPYEICGMSVYSFVDSNLTFIILSDIVIKSYFIFRHRPDIRYHLRYLKYFECTSTNIFCEIIKLCKEEFSWSIQGNFNKFDKENPAFKMLSELYRIVVKVVDLDNESTYGKYRVYNYNELICSNDIDWVIEFDDIYRNQFSKEISNALKMGHILLCPYRIYAWDENEVK